MQPFNMLLFALGDMDTGTLAGVKIMGVALAGEGASRPIEGEWMASGDLSEIWKLTMMVTMMMTIMLILIATLI